MESSHSTSTLAAGLGRGAQCESLVEEINKLKEKEEEERSNPGPACYLLCREFFTSLSLGFSVCRMEAALIPALWVIMNRK